MVLSEVWVLPSLFMNFLAFKHIGLGWIGFQADKSILLVRFAACLASLVDFKLRRVLVIILFVISFY